MISKVGAQNSVARIWNEAQLNAIRIDAARPPVQARNLFHVSMAMYDAWAVYHPNASTYLLGKTLNGFNFTFNGVPAPANPITATDIAISYAAYRVLSNRYALSPNWTTTHFKLDSVMASLGYTTAYTSTDYTNGNPAALGNFIAQQVILFGNVDGANQLSNYSNNGYYPINNPLMFYYPGNSTMSDVTHWQPLTFVTCIDQNGIPCGTNTPAFICPHWGQVFPFSMPTSSANHHIRNGVNYSVYHEPANPPQLNLNSVGDSMSVYCKWGHEMVAAWSSHLDPNDTTMVNISPSGKGNISSYPTALSQYASFYNFTQGGGNGPGYTVNPITQQPYQNQWVKRGDYTRVISQYWADGPNSETPPGHWYVMMNYVSDQPGLVKKIGGVGSLCTNIEWDVKCYFTLGASMHDAAVACWGIKGWFDSPRPISMIRKMAQLGQCTNSSLPNYHPGGMDLIPGFIEQVTLSDPPSLRGQNNINLNKIKIKAWKGFSSIVYNNNVYPPQPLNAAGVGWILAEDWMPYQRETFVTPPFAGYTSGHSTYSRAGALALTNLTGSPYFPGGLYEYTIPAYGSFLGFETGPTTQIKLQYASYKDASDEASLSRIWGGIHPPFDDMPARQIGEQIGNEAFSKANAYFQNNVMMASITANTTALCAGTAIQLTLSGTNLPVGSNIEWKKNGGTLATGTSVLTILNPVAGDKFVCEVTANGYTVGSNEIEISSCAPTPLHGRVFIQGYYSQAGTMIPVLQNEGQSNNPLLTDSITVELHEDQYPYTLIESHVTLLQTNGLFTCNFYSSPTHYYVALKHRNCLETWSAMPVVLDSTILVDFTLGADQTYGENEVEVEPGIWALYQGDLNQDGSVDAFDYLLLDPDIQNGNFGYFNTDFNGDGSVDVFDYLIAEPNITNGLTAYSP